MQDEENQEELGHTGIESGDRVKSQKPGNLETAAVNTKQTREEMRGS